MCLVYDWNTVKRPSEFHVGGYNGRSLVAKTTRRIYNFFFGGRGGREKGLREWAGGGGGYDMKSECIISCNASCLNENCSNS